MRMLLLSEGARDVGTPTGERGGAVKELVRQVLRERLAREIAAAEIVTELLPRLHLRPDARRVSGYAAKVLQAIKLATVDGHECVAVVIDRDGPDNVDRLRDLREGRAQAESEGLPLALKTALGVAIETVEAWLLADEAAINDALAPNPPAQACDPEGLTGSKDSADHPRARFRAHVAGATRNVDVAYEAVAGATRLSVLERKCSGGFRPFAEEVRARCV